jgi:hypothetical protein
LSASLRKGSTVDHIGEQSASQIENFGSRPLEIVDCDYGCDHYVRRTFSYRCPNKDVHG